MCKSCLLGVGACFLPTFAPGYAWRRVVLDGEALPHDPKLVERMRAALASRGGIQERKMFGGYCWMLNGNMLCGVEVGRYMFRVGKDFEAEALSRRGASPMDITGRPMRGFVWVQERYARGRELLDWIELASRFAGSLPPK